MRAAASATPAAPITGRRGGSASTATCRPGCAPAPAPPARPHLAAGPERQRAAGLHPLQRHPRPLPLRLRTRGHRRRAWAMLVVRARRAGHRCPGRTRRRGAHPPAAAGGRAGVDAPPAKRRGTAAPQRDSARDLAGLGPGPQGADTISVVLTPPGDDQSREPDPPTTWTSHGSALVVHLGGQGLTDGDYELSLLSGTKVIQQANLRLRSSSTPDSASWLRATPLAHDLDTNPVAVLRAAPLTEPPAQALVRGPYASPHSSLHAPAATAPGTVWWDASKPRTAPPPPPIAIAAPDPKSCVVTGAHRLHLPTYYGHPTSSMINGVCENCGLVKRFPARFSARQFGAWSGRKTPVSPLNVDVSRLPEVTSSHADWDIALDSLTDNFAR